MKYFVGAGTGALKRSKRKLLSSKGYMHLWGVQRMLCSSSVTAAAILSHLSLRITSLIDRNIQCFITRISKLSIQKRVRL